jgi:hypothetical protein
VHVIALSSGPALKRRCIAADGSEVAVVQPVKDGLFLLEASVALLICCGVHSMVANCEFVSLFAGRLVVLVHPSRPDQDDITDLDISALSRRPNVNPLPSATCLEVSVRDSMCGVAGIVDLVRLSIGPVVEEEGAASEAVVGPVMDAVFVVGTGAVDIGAADAVVEGVGWDVGELVTKLETTGVGMVMAHAAYVSEAVPLSPTLGI